MMTVRFPTGLVVEYATADFADRHAEYTDLYTEKDGEWIAQVPNTCIIENVPASRVYSVNDNPDDGFDYLPEETPR